MLHEDSHVFKFLALHSDGLDAYVHLFRQLNKCDLRVIPDIFQNFALVFGKCVKQFGRD